VKVTQPTVLDRASFDAGVDRCIDVVLDGLRGCQWQGYGTSLTARDVADILLAHKYLPMRPARSTKRGYKNA
jgi:hypothetical protein